MVDCIIGEKSWLNLCIEGTKNSTEVCQREKRSLHDAFTFHRERERENKKQTIFSNYESNDSRKC
jgi:hypothetical protein